MWLLWHTIESRFGIRYGTTIHSAILNLGVLNCNIPASILISVLSLTVRVKFVKVGHGSGLVMLE